LHLTALGAIFGLPPEPNRIRAQNGKIDPSIEKIEDSPANLKLRLRDSPYFLDAEEF
jgi:hypothetical protein